MNHDNREGLGPQGSCICINCGHTMPHTPGVRCMDERCPRCGKVMFREGSYHHKLAEARKGRGAEPAAKGDSE